MRLYLTAAGVYAGTQQEAKADGKGWRLEEVPTAKYELIDYLNALKHGEKTETVGEVTGDPHSEDDPVAHGYGSSDPVVENFSLEPGACPPKHNTVGYAKQAVAFEDEFEKMPLALKLHYAALAMEAARDELIKEPQTARRSWDKPQEALG